MKPITEAHVAEPGLIAVEIAAADEATAAAAAAVLDTLWWSSGPSAPWRTPGEPGVRIRLYADLRGQPAEESEPPGPFAGAGVLPNG